MKFIIKLLAFQLALFQVLDGTFTYMGVSRHGSTIEGNLFVKFFIDHMGAGPGLFLIKSVAIFFCFIIMSEKVLLKLSYKSYTTVSMTLVFVNTVYLFVIVAWIAFLIK